MRRTRRWLNAAVKRLAIPALLLGPPLGFAAYCCALESIEFVRTGMCHAEPTDIPARPCTLEEFLFHFEGSWDLVGLVLVAATWLPVGPTLCLGRWALVALLASRSRRAVPWVATLLLLATGGVLLAGWSAIVGYVVGSVPAFVAVAGFWAWSVAVALRAPTCEFVAAGD
jgi:hypothetical protein